MNADSLIDVLPRTSFVTLKKLKKNSVNTVFDLINHFPIRHADYSKLSKISRIQTGETVTVKAKIISKRQIFTRRGLKIQSFTVGDETGNMEINFFNQPYLLTSLPSDKTIAFSGDPLRSKEGPVMIPKEFEIIETDGHFKDTGAIVPYYSAISGLSSKTIREKIFNVLQSISIEEYLPEKIIKDNEFLSADETYRNIHFPKSFEFLKKAKKRLAFEELFIIKFQFKINKKQWDFQKVKKPLLTDKTIDGKIKNFIDNLPFKLTFSQETAWKDIFLNLISSKPMNRFVQGEVGSGKTILAILASYLVCLNKQKVLLMAPTTVLASQHFETFFKFFKKTKIKVGLYTSSKKAKNSDILIGTQALISKKGVWNKVGLAIIDEQHRFGVSQRAKLKELGLNPHILVMTATPIPRTVVLAIYDELDMSVLSELPKNRTIVKSYVIPEQKRIKAYAWIDNHIKSHKTQAFIVCPRVEGQDAGEDETSVKAAKKEYEKLKKIFSGLTLGLLHGKMKNEEKENIMNDFSKGKTDILVTTSVIEVGIDIGNATIILIEGAERFGLSQLHQLRGRVGRGDKTSYCFLFTNSSLESVEKRLSFFVKTKSGSLLAQEDLKNRGPGELLGLKQHGFADLKLASYFDHELIVKAKDAVGYFFENGFVPEDFPLLNNKIKKNLKNEKTVTN